jgi:hypothetical protein
MWVWRGAVDQACAGVCRLCACVCVCGMVRGLWACSVKRRTADCGCDADYGRRDLALSSATDPGLGRQSAQQDQHQHQRRYLMMPFQIQVPVPRREVDCSSAAGAGSVSGSSVWNEISTRMGASCWSVGLSLLALAGELLDWGNQPRSPDAFQRMARWAWPMQSPFPTGQNPQADLGIGESG